jgi:cytochrome c-type biogenesis protein CcmH/NrfF
MLLTDELRLCRLVQIIKNGRFVSKLDPNLSLRTLNLYDLNLFCLCSGIQIIVFRLNRKRKENKMIFELAKVYFGQLFLVENFNMIFI